MTMNKNTDKNDLHKITPKFIPKEDLRDPPARLFRELLEKMQVGVSKWNCFLREYLTWSINDEDKDRVREQRITAIGNIKTTYFMSPTLTFNKFLEGLSILKAKEYEIIIRVTDYNGDVIEVSEKTKIYSSYQQAKQRESKKTKTTTESNSEQQ